MMSRTVTPADGNEPSTATQDRGQGNRPCPCCERPAGLCLCDPNRPTPPGPPDPQAHDCATTQSRVALTEYSPYVTRTIDDYSRHNVVPHIEQAFGWLMRMTYIAGFRAGAAWQARTGGDGRKS